MVLFLNYIYINSVFECLSFFFCFFRFEFMFRSNCSDYHLVLLYSTSSSTLNQFNNTYAIYAEVAPLAFFPVSRVVLPFFLWWGVLFWCFFCGIYANKRFLHLIIITKLTNAKRNKQTNKQTKTKRRENERQRKPISLQRMITTQLGFVFTTSTSYSTHIYC